MGLRTPPAWQIGLALVLTGVCLFEGWRWGLLDARIWVPLDVAISLSPGQIHTDEFEINVESRYWVYLEAEQKSDIDRVRCLPGVDECKNKPSVPEVSWSLSDGKKAVARGNSGQDKGAFGGETLGRGLGYFADEKGKHYVLSLAVRKDGSRLNAGNPRLKVEEQGGMYASTTDKALLMFLFSTLLVLLGTGMLVRFALRWRRAQYAKTISLAFPGPKIGNLYFETDVARVRFEPTHARRPLSAWLGCVLIVMGAVSYAGIQRWMSTRTFDVVDMPVSLAGGHIRTGPFTTNLEAQYEIWIDIDQDRQLRANCVPYSVLQTKWTLYHDGSGAGPGYQELFQGTSLGVFDTQKGTYDLDIEVLQDAGCLNPGHPRLTVRASKRDYADETSSLRWLSALSVLVGATLLVLPGGEGGRKKSSRPLCLSDSETISQNFQWAQKLPLKRKFSGIPSFGLLAALVYFAVVIPVWIGWSSPRGSKGLPILVLKPGATRLKSDPWTELLIVRIEDQGAAAESKLYMNSKEVTWEDFGSVMKQELGRRPPSDRIVYLEGDPDAPWADPLNAIDIVRGAGGKVILLTPKSPKLQHSK